MLKVLKDKSQWLTRQVYDTILENLLDRIEDKFNFVKKNYFWSGNHIY